MTRLALLLAIVAFVIPVGTSFAEPASGIIVKYRDTGPSALEGCAETLSVRGEAFRTATRDDSGSLDAIHRRFGLRRHRSLFPSGRPANHVVPGARPAQAAAITRLRDRQARLAARSRRAALRRRTADSSEQMAGLAHIYRVALPLGQSMDAAVAALAADPHVDYAQPDYAQKLDQAETFDDPYLFSEGSWGQPYADLWGAYRVRAPEVWPIGTGAGAVVAVVDTGLDRDHPDIAANVWVNPGEDLNNDGLATAEDENGIDDDGNGFIDDLTGFDFANSVDVDEDGRFDGPGDLSDADPFDDNGHGTHIAGTIAAVGGNGLGIVGIAPDAKIMALKGFPAEGSGRDSVLWRAVLYAAENGASVINTSWSCGRRCPTNPLAEEVLEIVDALGAIVVTSAGNATEDVLFRSPENTAAVITVGSAGAFDEISSFSNTGWLLDLVAPGGEPGDTPGVRVARRNILSLLSSGARDTQLPFAVGDQYLRLAGTSMSAPHVTGAIAVLRALRPELTSRDVRHLLRLSAADLGRAGHDAVFGAGMLDLAALVEARAPGVVFELDSPRAGALHDPLSGMLQIRARADGADLRSVEVAIGRGLMPLEFRPLVEFGDSTAQIVQEQGQEVLFAEWDTRAVADGPHVIRVRANLADGQILDEYTVTGIERNTPVALSALTLDAGRPVLDGRQVYWHRDELSETEVTTQIHDPYSGRFPSASQLARGFDPRPRQLYGGEGDQRNLAADEGEIAWVVQRDDLPRIEYCPKPERRKKCVPQEVTQAPGRMSRPYLAKGWLVWERLDGLQRLVEGCRVGGFIEDCTAEPLVYLESSSPGSSPMLLSFDGETLLFRNASGLSLCRLGKSDGFACTSEPIFFLGTGSVLTEFVHERGLLAFSDSGTGSVWPPGCEEGVFAPGCFPSTEFLSQYQACSLEGSPLVCDPIPVSERVPLVKAQGVAVSKRRIAWSVGGATENVAIRFCEFDRVRQICPAQRLGGTPGDATHPAIEDDRIVWEDSRTGPVGIWGFALPRIPAERTVRVTAGRRFRVPVWAGNGMSASIDFELESVEGVSLEAAGARVGSVKRNKRFVTSALIRGEMPPEASGLSVWIIRARGEGGLTSEQRIKINVRNCSAQYPQGAPRALVYRWPFFLPNAGKDARCLLPHLLEQRRSAHATLLGAT